MPTVLWWGRGDKNYSRNRTIARLFGELGWGCEYFYPAVGSELGLIQAYFAKLKKPDLIWLPCFRQRDMASAIHFGKKWNVPVVSDPLTSSYQKQVYERGKFSPDSRRAQRLLKWEAGLFKQADLIVLENSAYADFVRDEMGVPEEKLGVLYNGAYTKFFTPQPSPQPGPPFEVGFVGSFQPSMGTDVIVKAARLCQDLPVKWTLIGEGDDKPEAEQLAKGLNNIEFTGWVKYETLPERMGNMHILLGIFGVTRKTDFVIPNKIFEAMAVARPLITQQAAAYADNLGQSPVVGWVERGNERALADKVREWIAEPQDLPERGLKTRELFDRYFGDDKMRDMLRIILDRVLPGGTKK
ncbi:glycosyltransferase [Desulfatibacillum aliphaticivorans]|uniref:glycosyltransferase n=1 Tax=Desulfatibacillum aliphaticivorans TaxID=218208 RepID=UPI0009FC128D|nr:glycosyltransferase [Desulfatibacillum aliphaticivorans]